MSGRSRPCASSEGVTIVLTARVAARNIPSVTLDALLTSAPSPTPGKMKRLFPCDVLIVRPFHSIGANGLPVARSPRPSVARASSSGVHSVRDVGLESAMTTGRGVFRDDLPQDLGREQTSLRRNADQDRRLRIPHDVEKTHPRGRLEAPGLHRTAGLGVHLLLRLESGVVLQEKTLLVERENPAARLLVGEPLLPEHRPDHVADPRARLTHPDHDESLVLERALLDPHGRHQGGERRGARSLNVVVEREDPLAVALEVLEGLVLCEVLPLEKGIGEVPLHAENEPLDDLLVRLPFEAAMAVPEVERVAEQAFVVRADVEADGKADRRMEASGRHVEADLSDRDSHPVGAQVAEAQDPFAVGHDDEIDVRPTDRLEDLVDPVDVLGAHVDAPETPLDVAQLQARLSDGGRVDDGYHLRQVVAQEPVEERLAPVEQAVQEDVTFHGVWLPAIGLERPLDLHVHRGIARADVPVEAEREPFLPREARSLVQERVVQELAASDVDLEELFARQRVDLEGERFHLCATSVAVRCFQPSTPLHRPACALYTRAPVLEDPSVPFTSILAFMVLGAVVGFAAGLLGVGGGLLLVPCFTFLFPSVGVPPERLVHMGIATSLATIMFTSISSVAAHHRRDAVLWPIVKVLAPGILVGSWIGPWIGKQLTSAALAMFFALFVAGFATQMLLDRAPAASRELPGTLGMLAAGGVIGILSGLVGVGGAFVSVPFMTWCNVRIHNAVGTSAALGFPIAFAGTLSNITYGMNTPGLPRGSLGFVFLPALLLVSLASVFTAPLGARTAHRLPVKALKRVFALTMLALAGYMLTRAFR